MYDDFITWSKSQANVQNVQLQFRDIRDHKHAQISDLKISYCDPNISLDTPPQTGL